MAIKATFPPQAADLYCDLGPARSSRLRDLIPGLTVAGAGTLAAAFLSQRYGAPLTLLALLMGLSLNFLSADQRLAPGLEFASRSLLRWGILFIGLRVTASQVTALGAPALLALLGIMAATIVVGLQISKRIGLGAPFGLLVGGSVAICGASAAMAITAILGEKRIRQSQLTIVIVGVSAMSATAMIAYPLIAHMLAFDDLQAGYLSGAAIHDVAQALGAGYSFSEAAGRIAAVVKLTRVALLAPILLLIGTALSGKQRGPRTRLPWFVIGFFVLAVINSTGFVPSTVAQFADIAASTMLAVAVTAIAIRSRMTDLIDAGARPLLVIFFATAASLIMTLIVTATIVG